MEIDPSAETSSVVFLLLASSPPSRRTAPEGRPQQRLKLLFSLRCTGTDSHVEIPSNFTQDRSWFFPPQSKLLQKVGAFLGFGISPAEQYLFQNGSNLTVLRIPPPLFSPAAIRKPPVAKFEKL